MKLSPVFACALLGALFVVGTSLQAQEMSDETVVTYEGESRGENLDKAKAVAEAYCQKHFKLPATLRSLGQRDGKNFALFKCM
jgi:hypothetical protein